MIGVREAAAELGITPRTLRSWSNKGKIKTHKTLGGHRRFILNEIMDVEVIKEKKLSVCYCRVSTRSQKEDLEKQMEMVETYSIANGFDFKTITDIGSGLNYNKKGLKELISLIVNEKVERIIIAYKDRLIRFGFEIIEQLCEKFKVELITINQSENKTVEQELVDDVLSIITEFSVKLYGLRSIKTQTIINENKKIFNQK